MEDPVLFIAKSFLHLDKHLYLRQIPFNFKKNLCFRKWKQQKHNNKRKLQSNRPRFITTTNYLEHFPNILNIQSKHELSQLPMKIINTHAKEFHKKAQFHLHRLAEGAMKFCYSIKKNTLGCQPVTFNFSVDILQKRNF